MAFLPLTTMNKSKAVSNKGHSSNSDSSSGKKRKADNSSATTAAATSAKPKDSSMDLDEEHKDVRMKRMNNNNNNNNNNSSEDDDDDDDDDDHSMDEDQRLSGRFADDGRSDGDGTKSTADGGLGSSLNASKREKRLALNRASARARRKRKKELIDTLSDENNELKRKNESIMSANHSFQTEIQNLHALNRKLQSKVMELEGGLDQARLALVSSATASTNTPAQLPMGSSSSLVGTASGGGASTASSPAAAAASRTSGISDAAILSYLQQQHRSQQQQQQQLRQHQLQQELLQQQLQQQQQQAAPLNRNSLSGFDAARQELLASLLGGSSGTNPHRHSDQSMPATAQAAQLSLDSMVRQGGLSGLTQSTRQQQQQPTASQVQLPQQMFIPSTLDQRHSAALREMLASGNGGGIGGSAGGTGLPTDPMSGLSGNDRLLGLMGGVRHHGFVGGSEGSVATRGGASGMSGMGLNALNLATFLEQQQQQQSRNEEKR